jgi:hypothetical protein
MYGLANEEEASEEIRRNSSNEDENSPKVPPGTVSSLANDVITETEEGSLMTNNSDETDTVSNQFIMSTTPATTPTTAIPSMYVKNSKRVGKKQSDQQSVTSNQSTLTNNLKLLKKTGSKNRIIRSMQNLFSRSRSESSESLNNPSLNSMYSNHNNGSLITSLIKGGAGTSGGEHSSSASPTIAPTTAPQPTPPNPNLVKALFVIFNNFNF